MSFNSSTGVLIQLLSGAKRGADKLAYLFSNITSTASMGNNAAVNASSTVKLKAAPENLPRATMVYQLASKAIDSLTKLFNGLHMKPRVARETMSTAGIANRVPVFEDTKLLKNTAEYGTSSSSLTFVMFVVGLPLIILSFYCFDISLRKDLGQSISRLKAASEKLIWICFLAAWLSIYSLFCTFLAYHIIAVLVGLGPGLVLLIGSQVVLKRMLSNDGVQFPPKIVSIIHATTIPYPSVKMLRSLKQTYPGYVETLETIHGLVKKACFSLLENVQSLSISFEGSWSRTIASTLKDQGVTKRIIIKLPIEFIDLQARRQGLEDERIEALSSQGYEDDIVCDDESDVETDYTGDITSDNEDLEVVRYEENVFGY